MLGSVLVDVALGELRRVEAHGMAGNGRDTARESRLGAADHQMNEHHLFPSLAYTALLDDLAPVQDRLIADVLELAAPGPDDTPVRTRALLQDRPEAHWAQYFASLGAMIDRIASTLHPRWTSRSLTSWGLVFRSTEQWPGPFVSIHAHSQATFSSVCHLSVPPELEEDEGGTLIRNPLANIHHRYYDVDYVRFAPRELGVVVFPGFLEHLPERPERPVTFSSPRIVVATDYCFY